MPLARLRQARGDVRYRSHGAVAGGADACLEQQVLLPYPPFDQDVWWVVRSTIGRRHHCADCADRVGVRTEPHGAAMFPTLAQPTGELDLPESVPSDEGDRSVMMPKRKQTRDDDRRDRINAERRERTELIAEEERQRQAWLAANYEPPPF